MNTLYLLMRQYCERERDLPASHRFNVRNHAFHPSWFWLTVLDILRYTGMRQNQLLHLRLCDINLGERSIALRIAGAKNYKEHCVPIVSILFPQLKLLVNRSLDAGAEPEDQLFNVGRFTVSPHRFRHTIATHMMQSPDRNLQAVKKLLEHVSIQSTLEYIDENVDSLRDILEKELM
ncbi:Phage integrase [Yersinia frederiksenii]|nr:Phage integrase [Yersinia frederiksenii]